MELIYYSFIILCAYTPFAISHFDCIGTCYSGRLLPEPQDISHGKHLKGFSYKNITTDDPTKCYSSCTQDCRCKACQMKDSRCELLDADKTSKADNFVAESGYVYYDLTQTMYQGKSHMIPPGVCYNGCCRSQPCLNGGTCTEHCQSPREKFTCKCAGGFEGNVCENIVPPESCLDILKWAPTGIHPSNGIYQLWVPKKQWFRSGYCDFSTRNEAWTLITSYRYDKNSDFKYKTFFQSSGVNVFTPNFNSYKMGIFFLKSIRAKSTIYRATCDFEKRYQTSLIPDLLTGNLSDYDIMNAVNINGACVTYTYVNVRGKEYRNVKFPTWHGNHHMHIGSSDARCGFSIPGSVFAEANFGFYGSKNSAFTCTKTSSSTTNWWMGGRLPDT